MNKPVRDPKVLHQGICLVFEMRQGVERTDAKAHLPCCQTNTAEVAGRCRKFCGGVQRDSRDVRMRLAFSCP